MSEETKIRRAIDELTCFITVLDAYMNANGFTFDTPLIKLHEYSKDDYNSNGLMIRLFTYAVKLGVDNGASVKILLTKLQDELEYLRSQC